MAGSWIRSIDFPDGAKIEKTLVLIKPDNFKFPNLRPGGVIEVFSRTGLYIIGFKVHRMSVAQAKEFYGPVLPVLEEKLGARERPRKLGRHCRIHGRTKTERMPAGRTRRAGNGEMRLLSFIRVKTPSAKFAKCSARPIRPKRLRVLSERNLVRRS